MRILIAYDGSPCADAALDDLQRAGLPATADVLVIFVTETSGPLPPPSMMEILTEPKEASSDSQVPQHVTQTERLLGEGARRLQNKFPTWQVKTAVATGNPAKQLLCRAEEWEANLLVVGSHGRTALNRLILGSVSQSVMSGAKCSVRIARGRLDEPGLPVRILIGIDASEASRAAVREVARREWPSGTEVKLIAVEDPMTPTLIGRLIPAVARAVTESNREELRSIEDELAQCTRLINRDDLKVSTIVRKGEPKRVLVQLAQEWRADCVFVGATGVGTRLERFVLGSTSAAVAAQAHCSVEVVKQFKG